MLHIVKEERYGRKMRKMDKRVKTEINRKKCKQKAKKAFWRERALI